jgi:acetyl-CoA C-acetyltransferase
MVAVGMAYRGIKQGETRRAMAGVSENMSNVPYFLEDLRWASAWAT